MKKPNNKFKKSKVKLISGSWRGRSIEFIEKDKLRPTKNIIKETLFNLLQHVTVAVASFSIPALDTMSLIRWSNLGMWRRFN